MFGLMRAKKCGMSEGEKYSRRLNYCGTCKTIGSVYGAKARLLLNHDVVFLAELLTAIRGESVDGWQRSYQSFNCLSLPKDQIPASLRFAAAANVILTEFKLADHVADSDGSRYKIARRAFSNEFQKAERFLSENGFPLEEVAGVLGSQTEREASATSLDDLAFPTAHATGVFFREGVRHIGRDDLSGLAYELGSEFGKLVYLIDAFEDYEKDVRRGHFNAFGAIFELEAKRLGNSERRKITAILTETGDRIKEKILCLPIAESQRSLFVSRLSENLYRKLRTELPVLRNGHACAAKPHATIGQRWRDATKKAGELARNYSWQMPLVFSFVLLFTLVAPAAQVKEARSARECFDLGFNLMFLGAVFGSVMALPAKLLMSGPNIAGEAAKQVVKQKKGGGSGWCDSCDCCDCCDGCDCCCECGDCCSCDC